MRAHQAHQWTGTPNTVLDHWNALRAQYQNDIDVHWALKKSHMLGTFGTLAIIPVSLGLSLFFDDAIGGTLILVGFLLCFGMLIKRIKAGLPEEVKVLPLRRPQQQTTIVDAVLPSLWADMRQDSSCHLSVDLRNYTYGERLSDTKQKYRHEWLSISGTFFNGHQYKISTYERVARKKKRKGLVQHVQTGIKLRLSVPKRHKTALQDVVNSLPKLKASLPFEVRRAEAGETSLSVEWRTPVEILRNQPTTPPRVSSTDLMKALLSVYHALGRASKPRDM